MDHAMGFPTSPHRPLWGISRSCIFAILRRLLQRWPTASGRRPEPSGAAYSQPPNDWTKLATKLDSDPFTETRGGCCLHRFVSPFRAILASLRGHPGVSVGQLPRRRDCKLEEVLDMPELPLLTRFSDFLAQDENTEFLYQGPFPYQGSARFAPRGLVNRTLRSLSLRWLLLRETLLSYKCRTNAKVSDRGQPPLTFDLSQAESAGPGSLDRQVRRH